MNAQPYTRKMEVGANGKKMEVGDLGPGAKHFAGANRAVNSKFSSVFESEFAFIKATPGIDSRVPYILKGSQGRRKDRQAGSPITYPALILKAL